MILQKKFKRSAFFLFAAAFVVLAAVPIYAQHSGEIVLSMPSPKEAKIGETVTFLAATKNDGEETWAAGTYSASVTVYDINKNLKSTKELAGKETTGPGNQAWFFISYVIPEDFNGKYYYAVSLKYRGITIAKSDYIEFTAIGPQIKAEVEIIGDIFDQKPGAGFRLDCSVRNTGEVRHSFLVQFKIETPDSVVGFDPKKVTIEQNNYLPLSFDYTIPADFQEGVYFANVSVYEDVREGEPEIKYDEAVKKFRVMVPDDPPVIEFSDMNVSAAQEGEVTLRVLVRDDRGAAEVKVSYQLPGMEKPGTKDMQLVSGDNRSGIWLFKTDPIQKTGFITFLVEAFDTKLQSSKAEYKVTLPLQK